MKIDDRTFTSGLCAIGLYYPRENVNIGSVLRAAFCFRADMVAYESEKKYRKSCADTTKAYKHIPMLHGILKDMIPRDCIPVAVDLVDDAVDMTGYKHPKSAFYVFGPENGTLGKDTLSWCRDKIYIPTRQCLNLAMCVNVVLYDRMSKQIADRRIGE